MISINFKLRTFSLLLVPYICNFQAFPHFNSLIVFEDSIGKGSKERSKFDYMFLIISNLS